MSELDNDNSNIFRKQKRIVEYIQSRNGKNYSINQLWNCWKVYLQEIFQMFCRLECMKIDSPEVALDDYTLIKKFCRRKQMIENINHNQGFDELANNISKSLSSMKNSGGALSLIHI